MRLTINCPCAFALQIRLISKSKCTNSNWQCQCQHSQTTDITSICFNFYTRKIVLHVTSYWYFTLMWSLLPERWPENLAYAWVTAWQVITMIPCHYSLHWTFSTYMIEQFNVDSKAERDQLNLAHVTIKKNIKKKLKQKKTPVPT